MLYEHPPRRRPCIDCPTCRTHAAVFRAQLRGSRFYCARCRKTFSAAFAECYSTAFSLGVGAGGASLADTVAFVPDTKIQFDVRVEPTNEHFPTIRLASLAGRRRVRSRQFRRQLGLVVAMALGLAALLLTLAGATRGGSLAERPASAQRLPR